MVAAVTVISTAKRRHIIVRSPATVVNTIVFIVVPALVISSACYNAAGQQERPDH
jgi:hypothetical protein